MVIRFSCSHSYDRHRIPLLNSAIKLRSANKKRKDKGTATLAIFHLIFLILSGIISFKNYVSMCIIE